MSRSTRILVIGAGAAGSAAIRELAQHEEISPTAIIETEVAPYNRTLINKAVATGLLDAYQAHLPALPVPSIRDSVHAVDPLEQTLRLRSGARLDYDALIVATGSAPHSLPPNTTSPAALDSGRVTHLHSLDDALRVRAVLERTRSPRVLIYGAGMIGAETAGILRDAGCRVTLAASSPIPGVSAFGSQVAGQLSQAHRVTVDTHFGHALTRLDLVESELHAAFTDGRVIAADLAISALGTRPLSPSPWGGAIAVDSRLRSRDHENVYAAGGVAVHETDGTTWRIDHWSDAEAQGAHAARSVLSSLGHADAPEPYRPCALYSAQIHQHLYVAAGHTGRFGTTRALSTSPLVLTHGRADRLVGVSGLDAGPDVMALVPRLHTSITPMLTAESNPSTDTPLGYMVECMNAGNPPHRHDHGDPGMQHSHPSPTPHGAHTGIAEHDAPEAHHDHGTHGDHEDHSGHEGHSGHGGHAGHGDHVGQFRRLFWINLILAVPVVAFSPMFAMLLGYSVPEFPGALWIAPVLGTVMYIWGGRPFLTGAVSEIRSRQPGMMLLIGLAITVAFIASWGATLGILDHQLDFWWELALLIVIMLLGHWVEMRSLAQTTSALDSLAALLPDMAERIEGDELVSISPNELQRGDLILVRPGASVPADGTIREGRADVDESMVTGESRPVTRSTGDSVVAGTVATDSSLRIEVTATGDDTALAGIQRLVTEAQNSSSRAQRIADTAAAWLFWFALGAAAITAITWSLLGMPDDAVVRTVTVLVIACPHALGLAIPLVVSIATERAARGGVLVKDRLALEAMRTVDAVLFDKTGTLTKGEPVLAEIITRGANETEVLALAAAAEAESEHPLARAIVAKAQAEGAQIPAGSDVSSTPALGVSAQVDGHEIRVGGPRLLEETGVSEVDEAEAWRQEGAIILHVLRDDEVIGGLKLTDEVRPESRDAIDALHSLGVEVVMITGDAEAVANSVGRELGIDRVFAGVRPEDKSSKVAQLQKEGKKVAMVGDGVNDAPALAQADVGIAIGAGTDVAIASAGVVLASSDPRSVLSVIELSRAAYRKMKQNLWWAAGYNLISVPLAAGILAPIGLVLPMSVGAILMSLSTIVVALNAQLLRRLDLRPEATVAAVRLRH